MIIKLKNFKTLSLLFCVAIKSYGYEHASDSENNKQKPGLSTVEKHDNDADCSYLDSMEKSVAEETNIVKKNLYQTIIKALKKLKTKNPNEALHTSLNRYIEQEKYSNNGYGFSDGKDGYFYLPQSCDRVEKIFAHLKQCILPRQPMTIEHYFGQPGLHTLIVGSGLCQEMLQPLTSTHLFQNPFYVDMDEMAFPDIAVEFGFKFRVRKNIKPYVGKFDGIYLDNFHDMTTNEVLETSFQVLNAGGLLQGNLRTTVRDTEKAIEEHKQFIKEKLEKFGFEKIKFSDNKEAIRAYGYHYYHFYAYKKESS